MREPERIDRILGKIRRLWHRYPDQRLGQLLENYVFPSGDLRGASTAWLFHQEDDGTEGHLDVTLGLMEAERQASLETSGWTPREANMELLKVIMLHLQTLQGGGFGKPGMADLQFCGRLHALVEKGVGQND